MADDLARLLTENPRVKPEGKAERLHWLHSDAPNQFAIPPYKARAYTYPWYDRLPQWAASKVYGKDDVKPWNVDRWKTYIGKDSYYLNRPAFVHHGIDQALEGYHSGNQKQAAEGAAKGLLGGLFPAIGAFAAARHALKKPNPLQGLDDARAVAAESNRRASATGWPADNVLVPTPPGGARYEIGAGGSRRIPNESQATSEQIAAFEKMPAPAGAKSDVSGVLPRYESPHRPPTVAETMKNASPEDRKKIEELQDTYLRLFTPGKGQKPN